MTTNFSFWTCNPFHPTIKLRETYESWPITSLDPCDEASGFARDYAMKWRDDPDFPDHPCHDRAGSIVLPADLDQHPADYVEMNAPAAPPPAEPMQLPYSGPMNIVASPINNDIKATYEKSRRGLKRMNVKPPVPEYEPPTPQAKGFTPSTPPSPPIAPRFYEADRNHPKYRRPGDVA
jgi:hypothetical protein